MNRTERLLHLLQVLRSYRHPVSGQKLAERLGCSIRTLYRDIATLQSQDAEITGEAGIGYVLRSGYFMPPLMFSQTEVEALMLGMLWVSTFGDQPLASAADTALAKIREVLPRNIKDGMGAVPLRVGPRASKKLMEEDLSLLREAIRHEYKIKISYRPKTGERTEGTVWPFAIGYFGDGRILACWCEEQKSYRHFRTDHITTATILNERYSRRREILFKEWRAGQLEKPNSTLTDFS